MAQPAGKQDAQHEVDRLRNFRSYLAQLEDENVLELSLGSLTGKSTFRSLMHRRSYGFQGTAPLRHAMS